MARKHMTSHVLTNRTRTQTYDKPDTVTTSSSSKTIHVFIYKKKMSNG